MPKVNPIPTGLHTITPHLIVKNAAQAIEFYQRAFGAVEQARHVDPNGAIMHAALKIGDSVFFLNDEYPGMKCLSPKSIGGTSVTMNLFVENADATFKRAVDAGAEVNMPLMDQFWGDRYGIVADPYGHLWAIATHIEDVSPADMERRAKEAMAAMSRK